MPRTLGDHVAGQLSRLCSLFDLDAFSHEYVCLLSELLGPAAAHPLDVPPVWLSEVSDDYTPVEYSITFDADRTPKLRFLVEPGLSQPDLRAVMDVGRRALEATAERYRFSLRRFRLLEDLFLPRRPQGPFGLWIAVELGSSGVPDFKIYLNPAVNGRDRATEVVRDAVARLGFGEAFPALLRHGLARADGLDRFQILSLDVGTHWERPRVKVYVQHDRCSLDDVTRAAAAVPGVRSDLPSVFSRLIGGRGRFFGRPLISSYGLFEEDRCNAGSYTVHVPVRDYVLDDADARSRTIAALRSLGFDESLLDRVLREVTDRTLSDGVGLISYVGLVCGPHPRRLTAYISSEAFGGTPPWRLSARAYAPSALPAVSRAAEQQVGSSPLAQAVDQRVKRSSLLSQAVEHQIRCTSVVSRVAEHQFRCSATVAGAVGHQLAHDPFAAALTGQKRPGSSGFSAVTDHRRVPAPAAPPVAGQRHESRSAAPGVAGQRHESRSAAPGVAGDRPAGRPPALMEPYRIKVVEPIPILTREERVQALEAAGYNLFDLRADQVTIDLLSDSGTGALSAAQLAASMTGDESYAGARSFHRFRAAVEDLTSYPHILPVHQGRAAERILFSTLLRPGHITVSNTHFDTTRANVELAGAEARDIPCPEAHDLDAAHPFKGNIDLGALERILGSPEGGRVALVVVTITNNGGGGQPVSMANLAAASRICRNRGVPLILDAARFAENAWLVTQRESEYRSWTPRAVAEAAFRLADGCVASMKKDGLVNIGGFIGLRDQELARRCELLLIATEGFSTYGGLAGRDLDMLAQGLTEVTEPDYLRSRAAMTRHLAELARGAGVAIVEPPGIHAVYLNAGRLLPHIPAHRFPGQALACALYLEGGIRSAELGSLYLGEEDEDGNPLVAAPYELVRLAIPRRVYTQSHIEYVGKVLAYVAGDTGQIPGYRVTERVPLLRHFKVKLEPVRCG